MTEHQKEFAEDILFPPQSNFDWNSLNLGPGLNCRLRLDNLQKNLTEGQSNKRQDRILRMTENISQ